MSCTPRKQLWKRKGSLTLEGRYSHEESSQDRKRASKAQRGMQKMICSQQNTESPTQTVDTSLPFWDPHPLCVQGPDAETWASEDRPGERTGVGCMETAWRGWTKGHTQNKPGPRIEVKWHVRGRWVLQSSPFLSVLPAAVVLLLQVLEVCEHHFWKWKCGWNPSWSLELCDSGSRAEICVFSLVREIRFHMLHSMARKKKCYFWQTHHQPNTGIWNRSRDAHSYHFYSTYYHKS